MATTTKPGPLVTLVTGDVTMDWNVAHIRRQSVASISWSGEDVARLCWQRGGAALVADLVSAVASRVAKTSSLEIELHSVAAPSEAPSPAETGFTRSHARWSPFSDGKADNRKRWRVSDFLGLDVISSESTVGNGSCARVDRDEPGAPEIVVLDDADLGFRDDRDLWPKAIVDSEQRPWIVLKMSRPVASGRLWDELIRYHAERLIVIVTIGDLRRTAVQVSHGVSWEETAEDLTWELTFNPDVNGLSRCAHAIVSLDTAGAMLLTGGTEQPARAELLFDPKCMEGEWTEGRRGGMIGNTATLTAAIVRSLFLDPEEPDLVAGIRAGISAMRDLFELGYEAGDPSRPELRFPIDRIADRICSATDHERTGAEALAIATVQPPLREQRISRNLAAGTATEDRDGEWRILAQAHGGDLDRLAAEIVLHGLEHTLRGIPQARFGGLRTVDRREIEALRSIGGLITQYCRGRETRPLSFAIFGPPGAGKSFAVKQVAEFVQPGTIEPVTFNLSQLDGPSDLLGAFHQVRDISLKGKLPLVFWDEFDTSLAGDPLGWLRYFLAPMQDGEFQEGQITHPIGRVIFAFAGGTAERMSAFGKGVPAERQKALKLPDFTSRLRGFLDVLGPNRQTTTRSTDPYFVIRRAILLRSLFERVTGQVIRNGELQIDRGVLRALLRVETYRHGARSIESLLSTSLLVGESRFNRSSLPPEAQLDLHVDAQEFLALVHLLELEGELLDGAARAIHDGFCRSREADGYRFGEKTDDAAMTHSALRPFDELPLNEQEQNRDAARDIPRKLATRRYVMMPDRRDESRFEFPNDDLDALAAAEHQRWMDKKLVDGWTPAPELEVPDKDNKRHPDLVPYEDLSDKEQEKDREQIRELVDVLAAVGYTVVRLRDRDPGTN